MNPRRGLTRVELLVVLVVLAFLVMAAWPSFYHQPRERRGWARLRSDMRDLATAIETYRIDQGAYPASTLRWEDQVDAGSYKERPAVATRTFHRGAPDLQSLTTPIAYISEYYPDPGATVGGTTYRYYADTNGWILGSWGPDKDQATGGQMMWDGGIEKIYDGSLEDPLVPILTGVGPRGAYNYDPTNGTVSAGDLWRVAVPLDPPAPRRGGP